MTDEAAELLGNTLAGAITAQGDTIAASIQSAIITSMEAFGALLLGFLIVAGIVALALWMKNAEGNRDPVLIIMAGLAIGLYSWGMVEPTIAQNAILQASVVSMVGIYLVVKAAVFALSNRKGD